MTDAEYNLCVDKYIHMVYRIAFHYFGSREDAEDITQEVFMKLYSSNISRENDEELKAWLIRVTTNACHSLFRSPFRKRRTDLEESVWEQIPANDLTEHDFIKILKNLIILSAVARMRLRLWCPKASILRRTTSFIICFTGTEPCLPMTGLTWQLNCCNVTRGRCIIFDFQTHAQVA